MFKIIADDGRGEVVQVKLSQQELSEMIARSIFQGVCASQQIEDEPVDGLTLRQPVRLPEGLLRIP